MFCPMSSDHIDSVKHYLNEPAARNPDFDFFYLAKIRISRNRNQKLIVSPNILEEYMLLFHNSITSPRGIEPRSQGPKPCILSIKLRALLFFTKQAFNKLLFLNLKTDMVIIFKLLHIL